MEDHLERHRPDPGRYELTEGNNCGVLLASGLHTANELSINQLWNFIHGLSLEIRCTDDDTGERAFDRLTPRTTTHS